MKVGLVLSGGLARVSEQAGFLKGFLSIFPREDISVISSSSIGALNALALSCDKLWYAEEVYRTKNFNSARNIKKNLRNKLFDEIFDEIIGGSEIQIPFYVTGTCLNSLSTHYFKIDRSLTRDEIYQFCDLTMTFPFVNGFVKKHNKRFYIDGSVLDNNPIYPLEFEDLDLIIVLHETNTYSVPAYLIDANKNVIDINVSSGCNSRVYSVSFKNKNLVTMFESAEQYGVEFAKKIVNKKDEELKVALREFKNAECKNKHDMESILNLVVLFNRLHQARDLE